ncbi:uncharacterized protein GLRG_03805 [Colletotrichum graminicola M1.001]|uniref:Uncharacterized protein n=1 Tax=Colletotrichum graminicola (strain M1.001 / M2 / FGSC 10212) TaxID=645133 RepID=E3QCS3_COLGM|nr:uncharacterized protein GLRG_03805 [Colletotrichum graminicola M1.001]EFQ28661.1 hypothetical protein GLRG_03805 [Colletotrichum graminicola M1.001]
MRDDHPPTTTITNTTAAAAAAAEATLTSEAAPTTGNGRPGIQGCRTRTQDEVFVDAWWEPLSRFASASLHP